MDPASLRIRAQHIPLHSDYQITNHRLPSLSTGGRRRQLSAECASSQFVRIEIYPGTVWITQKVNLGGARQFESPSEVAEVVTEDSGLSAVQSANLNRANICFAASNDFCPNRVYVQAGRLD
jgi:hypothetical protein